MRMKSAAAAAVLVAAMTPCVAFAQPVEDGEAVQLDATTPVEELVVENSEAADDLDVVVEEAAEPQVFDEAASELASVEESKEAADAADASTEMKTFVSRLYELVLGREPDEAGIAVQIEGMKTMGAGQIVYNFFNSDEFKNKSLSNEERVEIAYKALFNRESDPEGMEMWKAYLDNGMTANAVAVGFAESPEFADLCAEWGVEPGNIAALRGQLEVRDQNPKVTAYVSRLYRLALDRPNPDAIELNFQCKALLEGMSASQMAMNFFNSDEFAQKGLDPEEQVRAAYLAILDREPDEDGFAYWTAGFDYQMTIEGVVAGFANSDEFKINCAKWGVNPGTVEVAHERNKSQEITRAIYETYKLAFDRIPDLEGLDTWCGVCADRGLIWVCEGFLNSAELADKCVTNEEKVKAAYLVCLGREGDEEGVAGWTDYLDKGHNTYALLSHFRESEEFVDRCKDLKVPAGELHYYDVSSNHELNLLIGDIIDRITGRDAYSCYLYVSTFPYKSRGLWPSYEGWMEDYAIKFIKDGGGNCYGYAALFAYLARACGYDTMVHQGQTTAARGGLTPHGWCEVYVDGRTLVVDPDCYHELGRHCFMLPYGSTPLPLYR